MMKILWANLRCLVDQTSGASLSASEFLKSLKEQGFQVEVLSAANFDTIVPTNPIISYFSNSSNASKQIVKYDDGLVHHVTRTISYKSEKMTNEELWIWLQYCYQILDSYKPDLVMSYGAKLAEQWLYSECKIRGIPTVKYLVNPTYDVESVLKNVTGFITDTHFTADHYKTKFNLDITPVGKFLTVPSKSSRQLTPQQSNRGLLFINPQNMKGALFFVQICNVLHDLKFKYPIYCVSSRASLSVLKAYLQQSRNLSNHEIRGLSLVTEIENTSDIDSFYAKSSVLLVPSLWEESGARVIYEAQCRGLPVIASNRGGNSEMVGEGGDIIIVPDKFTISPYDAMPTTTEVKEFVDCIQKYFQDDTYYIAKSKLAIANTDKSNKETSTLRLIKTLTRLMIKTNVSTAYNDKKQIIFDCGGHDGCSSIKLKLLYPQADILSFEPNPNLELFYKDLPTTLIPYAVSDEDGNTQFRLDTIDADGSSIIDSKQIDLQGERPNSVFPAIDVRTINLSSIIKYASTIYDEIILKLDVEGAEYQILDKMMHDGIPANLNVMYAEFHSKKIKLSQSYCDDIEVRIRELCDVKHWDALSFAVVGDQKKTETRNLILTELMHIVGPEKKSNCLESVVKFINGELID